MANLFGLLCHDRDAIAQMIQNSDEHRKLYKQCCEESTSAAVSTNFSHLRAAKLRIETWVTPLSRILLDPEAIIGFAEKVMLRKKGTNQAASAAAFLGVLNGSSLILAAMMADAGMETLHLIRLLDTENLLAADLCSHIKTYMDHIAWMFLQRGVLTIQGHTAFIMQWYARRTYHFRIGTVARAMGGTAITAGETVSYTHLTLPTKRIV